MEPTSTQKSSAAIPIAIICGFGMIALAIYFTGGKNQTPTPIQNAGDQAQVAATDSPRPVDETDYIRGNPNAPILLIEYSDYDCPFCKQYHDTMNQIMDEKGVTGRVAWVYRQFPVAQLHPNSPKISEAALCVGDIGGNDSFWQFTDLIFEQRDATDPTNVTLLPDYAEASGVDKAAYIECMSSGRMAPAVVASAEDAYNAGARGTPYTVVVAGNQQAVITGAQPYDIVDSIVTNLIAQLEGTFEPSTETPLQ